MSHGSNGHQRVEPLGPRMVEFFSKGGKLGAAKGYEPRPGQATMAGKVAEVIEGKRHLVVEAGTGTGKSLAYLVPAAYAAEECECQAAVARVQATGQATLCADCGEPLAPRNQSIAVRMPTTPFESLVPMATLISFKSG